MKNAAIVVIIIFIILAGGGLLTAIAGDAGSITELLPFLQQTGNPEASVMEAEPWQVEQLFLLIGFLLFNIIGIGLTIAGIMWFLNRQVTIVRAIEVEQEAEAA